MTGRDNNAYQITWLIRRLFRAMGQKAEEKLSDSPITAADRAILEFLYPDKALTVPEIAARYQVSRQHVQKSVNTLLEKKLVKTNKNPGHKRSKHILLSTPGRELFDSVLLSDNELIETWFKGVSHEKQKQLMEGLQLLLNQINEEQS